MRKSLARHKAGGEKTTVRYGRRTPLGRIVGGSAAVTVLKDWQTPVVQTVLLPAHARTTAPRSPADVSIANLQVTGPNSPDNRAAFSTPADTIFGGCGTARYAFDFSGFPGFTETNLSLVGPVAGPSSEIFNMTYSRGMGTDSGNTHSVVATGIPFAIPGEYDFEINAADDGTAKMDMFISRAFAAKKKTARKKVRRRVA